jgi:hypothetical protein
MADDALTQLYDRLTALKWHRLILGDDRATVREHEDLKVWASTLGPEGVSLYNAVKSHHFTGPPWGNERTPMPERPQLTLF